MKKKNFADLTDKQKEEEIAKLGTSLLMVIPDDAPFGMVTASLVTILGFQIVTRSKNPHKTLEAVVESLTAIVNKHSHDDDNDNTND
jgi:hypothetical protein